MENLTIVTGFWNARIDRSESKYLDNFKNVLALNHNMSIYIPERYKDFVEYHRRNLLEKTTIHITELIDIKETYFNEFWDMLESVRTNPIWYNSLHWLSQVPQGFSEWYNPIVMSKVFFIGDTYLKNDFKSNKFIWIDAGMTQHISNLLLTDRSIAGIAKMIQSVLLPSIDYVSNEIHGFNYNGYTKYTNVIPNWLCRATVFGVNFDYVEQFLNDYRYYLHDTLSHGYLGTEESIFTLLSCIDSNIYQRFHMKNVTMPSTLLQYAATL